MPQTATTRMPRLCLITVLVVLFANPLIAQDAGSGADYAFLFSYWPKDGQADRFDDGYREHLEWHRQEADPLTWLAWYVVAGERTGLFIDGTFGIALADMDNRVKPREDAANFQATAAPFADVDNRQIYKLRRDLSMATPLEDSSETPMTQVWLVDVKAGFKDEFESTLRSPASESDVTSYELIVGGRHHRYILMEPRANWAAFEEPDSAATIAAALTSAGGFIDEVQSEVWRFRPDLVYRP